jgi:hypothetical protein
VGKNSFTRVFYSPLQIGELLPKVLNQLGPEQLMRFCNLPSSAQLRNSDHGAQNEEDEDDEV